jgi:hypothetical protein
MKRDASEQQQRFHCMAARLTLRAAKADLCAIQLQELRTRYSVAFEQCENPRRERVAQNLCSAASFFELEARTYPTRAKKAVECMRLAVLALESKVVQL